MILKPTEGNIVPSNFYLDTSWYEDLKTRPDGISFMIMARDEGENIERAIRSALLIQDKGATSEIIVIDNKSQDHTPHLVEKLRQKFHRSKIYLYSYPYQISKPGLELYVTPINSVHSLVYARQWSLFKTKYQWVFRLDGDCEITENLSDELLVVGKQKSKYYSIRAIDLAGNENTEVYMYSTNYAPYYCRFWAWEQIWHGHREKIKFRELTSNILHHEEYHNAPTEDYYKEPPWWETEHKDTETAQSCRSDFQSLVEKFNLYNFPLYCRASNNDCLPMLKAIPEDFSLNKDIVSIATAACINT